MPLYRAHDALKAKRKEIYTQNWVLLEKGSMRRRCDNQGISGEDAIEVRDIRQGTSMCGGDEGGFIAPDSSPRTEALSRKKKTPAWCCSAP
jgi:hypothetical protein